MFDWKMFCSYLLGVLLLAPLFGAEWDKLVHNLIIVFVGALIVFIMGLAFGKREKKEAIRKIKSSPKLQKENNSNGHRQEGLGH